MAVHACNWLYVLAISAPPQRDMCMLAAIRAAAKRQAGLKSSLANQADQGATSFQFRERPDLKTIKQRTVEKDTETEAEGDREKVNSLLFNCVSFIRICSFFK